MDPPVRRVHVVRKAYLVRLVRPVPQASQDRRSGPTGEPGTAAPIDTLALVAEAIKAALPGIVVQTVDADGTVLDRETIPLGGTLNIHHRPLNTK